VKHYRDHGIRLCANIKPCLLRDHPRFKEVAGKGLLIQEESGKPTMVQFWDEVGGYLDFTNPETVAWWKAGVTKAAGIRYRGNLERQQRVRGLERESLD